MESRAKALEEKELAQRAKAAMAQKLRQLQRDVKHKSEAVNTMFVMMSGHQEEKRRVWMLVGILVGVMMLYLIIHKNK